MVRRNGLFRGLIGLAHIPKQFDLMRQTRDLARDGRIQMPKIHRLGVEGVNGLDSARRGNLERRKLGFFIPIMFEAHQSQKRIVRIKNHFAGAQTGGKVLLDGLDKVIGINGHKGCPLLVDFDLKVIAERAEAFLIKIHSLERDQRFFHHIRQLQKALIGQQFGNFNLQFRKTAV